MLIFICFMSRVTGLTTKMDATSTTTVELYAIIVLTKYVHSNFSLSVFLFILPRVNICFILLFKNVALNYVNISRSFP